VVFKKAVLWWCVQVTLIQQVAAITVLMLVVGMFLILLHYCLMFLLKEHVVLTVTFSLTRNLTKICIFTCDKRHLMAIMRSLWSVTAYINHMSILRWCTLIVCTAYDCQSVIYCLASQVATWVPLSAEFFV